MVKNNPELLKQILVSSHDLDAPPLYKCAQENYNEGIELILDALKKHLDLREDVIFQRNYAFCSALNFCANNNNNDGMKMILDLVKDDKALLMKVLVSSDDIYNLPLSICAQGNNNEGIKLIFDSIKDYPEILKEVLERIDNNYKTPFDYCEENNNQEGIQMILEAIQNGYRKSKESLPISFVTLLLTSFILNKDNERFNAILDLVGEDKDTVGNVLTHEDIYGFTPLNMCCACGNNEGIKRILGFAKNNPKLLNELLESEIVEKSFERDFQEFGKYGSDIPPLNRCADPGLNNEFYTEESNTEGIRIILDSLKGYPDIMRKILLQTDYEGNTPLHNCAYSDNNEGIKMILDAAKKDSTLIKQLVLKPNKDNKTLFEICRLYENEEGKQIILDTVKDIPNLKNILLETT